MPPRVLIVDDEAMVIRVLSAYLTRRGFEVTSAGSAEEGLELAAKERFPVILLDNSLPGITGLQAIQPLRASGAAVVLMTGHLDDQTRDDARLLGAVEVIGKPLDFPALEKLLGGMAAGGPQI